MGRIELDRKIYIFISGLILGAMVYTAGFYDRSILLDEVYGTKWLIWLIVTLVALSLMVSYFFVKIEKIGSFKKLLPQILTLNVLSIAILSSLFALAQKLVKPELFIDLIGGRYLVLVLSVILGSIIFVVNLYNRSRLVETRLSNGFTEAVNFFVPAISFMLIGFFIPEFRAMLAVLAVTVIVTFFASSLTKGLFNHDK